MRRDWYTGLEGLMTVVRVLPPDLYDAVMSGDAPSSRRREHARAATRRRDAASASELKRPTDSQSARW